MERMILEETFKHDSKETLTSREEKEARTTAKISPGAESGCSLIKTEPRRTWVVNNSKLDSTEEGWCNGKSKNLDIDSQVYLLSVKLIY